jgi:DNA-binding MarR family transcriptional regulator
VDRQPLTERQLRVLEALNAGTPETERGLYAGRVARLAGFTQSKRMDAGATATLDALRRRKLVKYQHDTYLSRAPGRRWWITDAGRAALAEYAFGE